MFFLVSGSRYWMCHQPSRSKIPPVPIKPRGLRLLFMRHSITVYEARVHNKLCDPLCFFPARLPPFGFPFAAQPLIQLNVIGRRRNRATQSVPHKFGRTPQMLADFDFGGSDFIFLMDFPPVL